MHGIDGTYDKYANRGLKNTAVGFLDTERRMSNIYEYKEPSDKHPHFVQTPSGYVDVGISSSQLWIFFF